MNETRLVRFIYIFYLVVIGLLQPVSAQDTFQCNYTTDIDQDNDGLIELCDLDALNAVRYQLDGSGYRESFGAVKITAGCPQSGCTGYELRGDLDFNADDSYRNITNKEAWTSDLGWLPIGDRLNFFAARFEGNGHTIANLYINRPSDYVGLFKATTKLAKISDLVLSQININGNSYVGSLAGHNAGGVAYIGVEGGRLIGTGNHVGGLFGSNEGTILNGDVMLERIEGSGHSLGGLVGYNEGHITYSVADASLSGVNQVGGLVGLNFDGVLTDSRAAGNVKGRDYIGGLVGLNRVRISSNHAEAKVISEGSYSGGLVGANHQGGSIADSRASGMVSGNLYAGGLVGWNKDSQITNSFTVSRVEGNSDIGGLVGWNEDSQISNTYSSGFVTGVHRVGGLIGSNKGIVSDSFANGQVVASGEHVGGLIGWNYAHQTRDATTVRVIHSYWDREAAEILVSAGGSPRTTAQLKSPTTSGLLGETFERWDTSDWEFGTNEQYPILRHSEGSNRGLLPDQHIMLSGLLVLDGLTLSPAFNPQTFDYRVYLIDDSAREIRFSPTIANSTQTISILKDEETSLPSVQNGETVPIILNISPKPTLVTIARHYRIWVIRNPGLEATISSDRSDYRVSEGQRITFNVSTSEPDLQRVRYRWSQVSPTQLNLLKDLNTRQAQLAIDIPDDFVAQDDDDTFVVLQVEVRAGEAAAVRNTTMTVVKTDSGNIGTLVPPIYSESTLTVAEINEADLSMDPDGGLDPSSFRYQWQYKLPSDSAIWQDIEDAVQMRYEIPRSLLTIDDIGYRVWLDYRDNQGYDNRVVSEPLMVRNAGQEDGFSDIYYLEDLYAIRNQLNGKYELVRDLDFNLDASYQDSVNKEKWTVADYENSADTGWLPIGNFANRFSGIFKGNGYTISNLQINRDTSGYQGLFGSLGSGSVVRDVGLVNVRVEGERIAGGLVGSNRGTIIGSYVVGEVHGLTNDLFQGIVGGLVGNNLGVIINSHATGRVLGNNYIGGLVGWNAANAHIINSYASSDVRGDASVGGLVGINLGGINNGYATGQVNGNTDVSGLVGRIEMDEAGIVNSYAIGSVYGNDSLGGLTRRYAGSIIASYWNSETSIAQGGGGIGKTTVQLQSQTPTIPVNGIYKNWDSADWDFGNSDQYPILKYVPGPSGDACGLLGLPQCGELISPRLRHGLVSLATVGGVALSLEFDVEELNQSGIYIGTLSSTNNTIRLIPTTIEPTAHIGFYIGDDETAYDDIRSGETSKAISLKEDDITRIRMEVQGTRTVHYTLYINYQNTVTDRVTLINYLEDLRAISHQPGGSYKLVRDLDFADNESYLDQFNRIFWTVDDYDDANDTGWVPIGSESEPFAGSFDGNGYTISGLQINRDDVDNQGLFGVTSSDALISNIGLLNLKVEGRTTVAGLVGINQGQVGYSYVAGSIESKLEGPAGGLVASNEGGDIIGSYAISEVSGISLLGGLVGDNRGRIINSHADSIIMPDLGSTTFGGLVGRNRRLIANSYATGKILASGNSIMGGLIGWNDSRVINGYASVSIAGRVAGGLVGYNIGSIRNSYAIGELKKGGRTEGSLVGSNEGAIVASYWNTDTIADRTVGNLGIGQNTIQLQSGISQSSDASRAYYEWSDNDWHFGGMDLYPILKHTPASESVFACGSSGVPQCDDLISPGLRYGLRGLSASDVTFHPPIDIERFNQSGVYVGTVFGEHPSMRLIPVAMETTARISIIGIARETIDSHDTSSPISLKNDRINKVVVEVEGTKTVRYTLYLNYLYHRVIDEDNDGLVDINYLEDLDAIRHQLDGSGYRADAESIKIILGCPSGGCSGYELLRDLYFNDADSYRDAETNMGRWTGAGAWQPIAGTFTGTFQGNNKTITNLRVRGNGGLFVTIVSDSGATYIDGIGLLGVDIKGNAVAGIATSCMQCIISNSYVIGNIEGNTAAAGLINTITATSSGRARISNSYFIGNLSIDGRSAVTGGLVGDVDSDLTITDSYVVGTITAQRDDEFIGGLIGVRTSSAIEIINSYASVSATRVGVSQGLFGGNRDLNDTIAPTVRTSYLDKDISGVRVTLGESKPTVELQSPTSATGIYMSWGSDNLGNSDNWDFGNDKQYPAIKYNLRGDVIPISDDDAHCGAADIQKRLAACQTLLRHQGSLLQDLQLSEGAGLSSPFSSALFDYGISVNVDRSIIHLLPTAFNAAVMIEVFKDGSLIEIINSGKWTMPIPLNDFGNTVVNLVVTEGNRRSYEYQFVVSRLNIVAQNIDKDGDGLIDISNATHLNAIRHRSDGSAYKESGTADVIYCPAGCIGYELTADIDLAEVDWQPIGSFSESFTSVFRGNGYTISNLTIKADNTNDVGLLAAIGNRGRVENVGLVNVNITGSNNVGSIAGYNFGTIINSYADGKLVIIGDYAGGLVGRNGGTIANSYANVDVRANGNHAGGLVGRSEMDGSIVNSYATGDVRTNRGFGGGLAGRNNRGMIANSYAIGGVRTNSGIVGGLTASGESIVNSYYRAGAVISGTDSLIGSDKTAAALKAGVPSDDIYTGWDRADWHFGNIKQYPALLYATGDGNDMACRQPSSQQISDCSVRFSASLSEHDKHDKGVVCRSHLLRLLEETPYCGTLLPGQRSGLFQLEFSENAYLIPAFNPEIYNYHLVVGLGTTFRTTPTTYYGTDTITINMDDLSSLTSSGQSSSFTLSDDLDSIVFKVQSATQDMTTIYTIKVHGLMVVNDLISIDYLEDLNLMRHPLAQVSTTLKDCPIDTQDNVRRCHGYRLVRDLDFKDPTSYRAGDLNPIWTTGKGWQPIGDSSNPFTGLFNGNGHTISNLRLKGDATGLFGVLANAARIENIGLLKVDIDVSNNGGALVGENHGEIVNSYVIGGSVRGAEYVGGLVAKNHGAIINSYTHVDVGIADPRRNLSSGGLAGSHSGDAKIHNSYARGMVGGVFHAGGLVGRANAEITNSYAISEVFANVNPGGLVGTSEQTTVTNSYAVSGILLNSSMGGGLIGRSTRSFVNASYWNVDTSEVMDDENNANGIGRTTAELQTSEIGDGIYSGWDSNKWYSGSNSQYPVLRYTSATDVLARPACRAADDRSTEMPVCGTLLPAQRLTGLSNLARSNLTGQVVLLRPEFDSGIYDYELILKSDAREFAIIPNAFNTNAVITLSDDSGTNPIMELPSGQAITLIIENINNLLLTLVVEDPLISETTRTTFYSIKVSKHPFITANDIDEDDDGLIEIRSADDLSAIRYQLDGSGYKASGNDTKITVGCPTVGCRGYELAASIDLSGFDWHPIGAIDDATLDCNNTQSQCFAAIFDGNRALGYEISGLSLTASQRDNVGLFTALADGARVRNVNLSDVDIRGRFGVGSLAAYNAGEIDNSYANGMVVGERDVGGLVAYNVGRISNSYAYGVVSGRRSVGGLVARNESGGMIANSYSLSRVLGNNNIGGLVALNLGSIANTYASGSVQGVTLIGGLIGENGGSVRDSYATASILCTGVPECTSYTIATGGLIGGNAGGIAVNSYWDIATSNIQESADGVGKTTVQLQSGNSQSSDASRAYYKWSKGNWHFGNVYQYPILKYTSSTESTLTGLQSYGLESLAIAEVVSLSPHFNTTKLNYRVGVELDANIRQLHLIPSASNDEAIIRIVSDNGFDETVESGTSSSAIMLHSTGTTVIGVEVSGDRRVRYHFEVDYFSSGVQRNVDTDKDGLIEILTLEDLDAIRNALDGRQLRQQNDDGILIENAKGCPITGCKGYELLQDLDFDNPAHYQAGRVNTAWTTGAGWQPIGTQRYPFTATFKGNGYTISNLRMNRPDNDSGLFGVIDGGETDVAIEGLGLSGVDIVGGVHVGGLVGYNRAGNISKSYVTGSVATIGRDESAIIGGLVGRNVGGSITETYSETQVKSNLADSLAVALAGGLVALNENRGRIENSYAVGSVIGRDSVGGLVASNQSSSEIINSYAVSRAIGIGAMSKVGGLVAVNDATVGDSYWDMEASGVALSAGGTSATTIILQSSTPTSSINSVYRNWGANVWEFADANRYPLLKAVNNARLLAPDGKSLLQSFILSDNVRLFPSFHPLIFDYDIIAESRQMSEVRIDTTSTRVDTTIDVACSDGLVCSSGIPLSFVLDGSYAPQITITTHNPDAGELSYNFSVRYATSEIKRVTATTTTTLSMPLTVAEGERVRLIAPYDIGLNEDSYRYRWRQLVGDVLKFNDTLSPVDTQSAVLDFTVPINVVSKQDDSHIVQLIVEIAVGEDIYLSKAISLIISKRDNDSANRVRLLEDNDKTYTYTVRFERSDSSEFVDRDGGFASAYIQWQRRRSEAEGWINLVSTPTYTIPNEGDYQYRALAVYEDQQGYREQFASEVINYFDIDDDNDGLIEIAYLEELDAIRYQPDGSGYKATASADKITTGCPSSGCKGYELINDLDFADDASYRTSDPAARSVLKNSWTVGNSNFTDASDSSWQPIGTLDAVFNGNGYTISNMQINRSVGTQSNIGLFSQIGITGEVKNLGLINPTIKGLVGIKNVGGIAGRMDRFMENYGEIINSYVVGDATAGDTDKIIRGDVGRSGQTGFIGGLVGWNKGLILNSYAKINVVAEDSETPDTNRQVGVGGLVGRNIDGGKVYNSYSTGEVKGPCIVGGLVGNQFSTNSTQLLTRSEVKNSYMTGNVETGFGTCSNPNIKIAGGLVGRNTNSTIENSYTLGEILGDGTLAGLVGEGSAASNSYWNTDSNCEPIFSDGSLVGLQCFGIIGNVENSRQPSTLRSPIAPNTELDTCPELSADESKSKDVCKTYVNWDVADWDFGTSLQYPALKYGIGLVDTHGPGCDKDPETALPHCDALLPGQHADEVLLNSLSLSANSRNVQLTPSFMPNRFNYEAVIESAVAPVLIDIVTMVATNTEITFRKDDGSLLLKQSDGSVQITTSTSFGFRIETSSANNRDASYQIQVRLKYPLQPNISKAVNGSTPTELIRGNIISIDEGDAVRLDAASSFGQNNPPLNYQWSQVLGESLLSQIQSTSTVEFTVPADFVARDEDEITVVLKLELSESNNPASAVSREILLPVRKTNNGNSEGDVRWISSETLSAVGFSGDIDGEPLADIDYQWLLEQSGVFIEIPNANQRSYTPPEDARNAQYRLSVSYTDGQGYQTNIHYDAPLYADIATHKDKDSDGLIEIETLEDLNAIRYQPDGSGYRTSSTASKITTGCPAGVCKGYELVRDLNFMDNASYSSVSNRATWTRGAGWQPIGTVAGDCSNSNSNCFSGIFDGNGYTISNLRINTRSNNLGLFSGNTGTIRNLGLSAVDIRRGGSEIGGLVGRNEGGLINVYIAGGDVWGNNYVGLLTGRNVSGSSITNSYVRGEIIGTRWVGGICGINEGGISNSYAVVSRILATRDAGGLVGQSGGSISNSYAAGLVSISQSQRAMGGLVGLLWEGGRVSKSYSTAEVKSDIFDIQDNNAGQFVGGLIGRRESSKLVVADSYWDIETSKRARSAGGTARTTVQLQTPTTTTDVYTGWSSDNWDFGNFEEYPALKYHDNSCGTSAPSPDCGKLLLHQRIGLRNLRLEQDVGGEHLHIFPDFDPAIKNYTVSVHADASELKITPIAANPDASIVADGKVLPANDSGYTIALNISESKSTVIGVAASNSMGAERPVVYKLTVSDNRLPRMSLNIPASIAEGETFAFNATIEDPEGDEFSYSLSVVPNLLPGLEGITGTVVGRADLRYQLSIPSDLLSEMQSSDDVDIVLTVDNGLSVFSKTMQLAIVKENNGFISVPEPTLNDFTYTINIDLSSDSDGINPNPQIAYQWQKELLGSWADIDGATDASYTVEGIIGDRYRVLVDYTDKQGYRHQSIVSPAVSAPQQFIYNVVRSRDVVRDLMDQLPTVSIQIRVFLEGLLR